MKMRCNKLLLPVFMILAAFNIDAQQYRYYSIENGLSKNSVTSILKDSRGFMWFGSWVGLNRFDGYQFVTYYTDINDSNTISDNNIRKILEDKNGILWIATTNGLTKYDFKYDRFERYFHNQTNTTSISSNYINSIFFDRNKKLWIATSEGIDKYNESTNSFLHFKLKHSEYGNEKNTAVLDIIQDLKGSFWLAGQQNGIICFVEETGKYTAFRGLSGIEPSGLGVDAKLFQKLENNLLYITASNGQFIFDLQSKTFSNLTNRASAIEETLLTKYTDNSGIEWTSIRNKGISIFDKNRNRFRSFKYNSNNINGLPDKSVNCIVEDSEGKIWIGTPKGICTYNPKENKFQNRLNSDDPVYRIFASSITSICFDGENQLWSNISNGIAAYNRKTNTVIRYEYQINNPKSLLSGRTGMIFSDSKGNIWVAASGLNLLDKARKGFIQFKPSPNSNKTVNSEWIVRTYEDNVGNIWFGTWAGGVNIYNPESRAFSFITSQANNKNSLNSNDVACIFEDSKGFLWFTSNKGITKYDRLTKKFEWYSAKDGLANNAAADMLEDSNGNLWISTGNGLSKFNPEKKAFQNYDVNDGLQSNEFTFNCALRSRNGLMYFAGINGLTVFNPDSIKENNTKPEVVITDFKVFNKSVKIGESFNGKILLEQNISITKNLTLTNNESVFSFEFAALHYSNPEKNKYAYKLEGFEQNWNSTDYSRRFVTYTNLNPGEYILHIIASNSDGLWNEEGCRLHITILPPWWKTIWFKIFLILIFVGLVAMFYYLQLNSIKKRNRNLEKIVKKRTDDLTLANSELENQKLNLERLYNELENRQIEILKQKEEVSAHASELQQKNNEILEISQRLHDSDQLKLRHFTNISHEFRTPLTLIISPLEKIISSGNLNQPFGEQLQIMKNNTQRLMRLVNQLLDLGKLDAGTMKVKKTESDFVTLTQTVFASFKEQSASQGIKCIFQTSVNELIIPFDFDKVEKILYNLLSNSFKFTPENGTVTLCLNVENNNVVFSVKDTGIGIPQREISKVCDPFYQVDSSLNRFHEGTGIGLYHTNELIGLMNGSFNIKSYEGKGTLITVSIPFEPGTTDVYAYAMPDDISETTEVFEDSPAAIHAATVKNILPALLIVEDNKDLRNYIKDEFKTQFRIIEAENGKIGLEKALANFPELIISDIMMPEMDGLEMCRMLKNDERISHIPIILLTAKADEKDLIEGLEQGADGYIAKPFNIKHLTVKVENLLQSRRRLKEKYSKEVYSKPSDITFTNADKRFVEKLVALIEENVSNESFQVADIAKEIGMGKTNLYKKVFSLTNMPVADFVRSIKLKTAAQLLLTQEYSVSEVAFKVGFKDTSHFIKAFTRQYDLTPKKFIEQQKLK